MNNKHLRPTESRGFTGSATLVTRTTTTSSLRMLLASFVSSILLATLCLADDWPQWRGPQRNGVSTETGLLQQWANEGPTLLWHVKDLGAGFSTPAVAGERLYVLSNEGTAHEFVQARDVKDGTQIWSTHIGKVGNPDQQPNYPGARSTPTVDGESLYALGSDGDLVCLATEDGEVRWRKHLRTDFGGKPGRWAYAESPLVDGDTLVCAPGGTEATIVALDKHTGAVIWKCALPESDEAAYASAIVVEVDGVRQYVHLLQKGLVGVAAETGELLWRYEKPVSNFNANIPTPVASEGRIYAASAGTGGGVVQLSAGNARLETKELYFGSKLPTAIGGCVKVGDFLYGTTGQAMLCVAFATGEVKWEARALGAASICYADGRLYLHGENGEVALVEPSPESYREKGRLTPPERPQHTTEMEKAWAYPVVANGRLYLREGESLWCYDITAAGTQRDGSQ